MSDMEFNTQVAEVMDMVAMNNHNRPRAWGILVSGDQVQQLLELEANREKLAVEVAAGRRELARVENKAREYEAAMHRAAKLPKIMGTAIRFLFPLLYLAGARGGLMDPWFAWVMGLPCIAWAVVFWKGA